MATVGGTTPQDFDALRAMIIERRNELPKRLMQVAVYALDHPDEIAFGTAASIATAAQVQPSTLVRFAQHFGFDGFSGLQQLFRLRLRGRNASYEDRLRKLDGGDAALAESAAILNSFVSAAQRSLDGLTSSLDTEQFERAVEVLAKADTIYLIAKRRSYPIASYMAYAFGKLKIRSLLVDSGSGIDEDMLALASPDDAAIAISFAPYAPESAAQARLLADSGVAVVALTDSALSPLVECSAVWLGLVEADHAGFRSLSASMALAMALSVSVAEHRRRTISK